ncbi:MAG: hypothetical protein LBQ09_07850, partial [Acidobacteriaceae bacterium]|nr:hypothetical protein [Acidobacteriaceae bacterium]
NTQANLEVDRYNKFMNDFLSRGGKAHAVVIRAGSSMGAPSEILGNLTQNTAGVFKVVAVSTGLKDSMQAIGNVITGKP